MKKFGIISLVLIFLMPLSSMAFFRLYDREEESAREDALIAVHFAEQMKASELGTEEFDKAFLFFQKHTTLVSVYYTLKSARNCDHIWDESAGSCYSHNREPNVLKDTKGKIKQLKNYLEKGTCIEKYGFLKLKKRQVDCSVDYVQANIIEPMIWNSRRTLEIIGYPRG